MRLRIGEKAKDSDDSRERDGIHFAVQVIQVGAEAPQKRRVKYFRSKRNDEHRVHAQDCGQDNVPGAVLVH